MVELFCANREELFVLNIGGFAGYNDVTGHAEIDTMVTVMGTATWILAIFTHLWPGRHFGLHGKLANPLCVKSVSKHGWLLKLVSTRRK
jgi:hypothetical protein